MAEELEANQTEPIEATPEHLSEQDVAFLPDPEFQLSAAAIRDREDVTAALRESAARVSTEVTEEQLLAFQHIIQERQENIVRDARPKDDLKALQETLEVAKAA